MQISRSSYCSLKPAYLGTCLSEGLSSYIARLAEAHSVHVGKLVDFGIVPLLNKHYLHEYAKQGGTGFYKWSFLVNGRGIMARQFVEALKVMTLRDDIRFTNLITLREVMPDKGLMRRNRAWCWACLEQQRVKNVQITEALIWSIKTINYCPIHEVSLIERCGHCGKESTMLARKHRNGFCSNCGAWLGTPYQKDEPIDDYGLFVSWEVGNLVADMPKLVSNVGQDKIVKSLGVITEKLGQGKVKQLARILSVPHITLRGWCKGQHVPELAYALEICRKCNVSLENLVSGKVSREQVSLAAQSSPKIAEIKRRNLNWFKIGQLIEEVHTSIENTMSLTGLADRLGVDRRLLVQNFPQMCKEIKEKYQKRVKYISAQRDTDNRRLMETVVNNLMTQDIYPSKRAVEEASGRIALLHETKLKTYWSELTGPRFH